jgi:UDPglucose 6-dehydrogenase
MGLWHLGCVTSACLSDLGYDVIGFDKDKSVIENLQMCKAPIYEPGLDDLLKKNIEKKLLKFTSSAKDALPQSEYVLLTIDTPVDDKDRIDLNSVSLAIDDIANNISDGTTVIVQSQVPVGTCNDFIKIIQEKRPTLRFHLAYCPENLRLGKAIEIFQKPDRIIIGADEDSTSKKVIELFSILHCPFITMDLRSAEMTKHAINAFLATCISFINWIGMICDEVGANPKMVSEGLVSEGRIGKLLPLRPGLGFAGGTLGRDLRILENLADKYGIHPNLSESIIKINHQQNISVIKKLLKILGKLDGLKICIFGLTYKAGTNTLRRSSSLEIIEELLKLNAEVNAYDPSITSVDVISDKKFRLCDSPYSAVEGTSALLIFTDWPQFKELDYKKIHDKMRKPVVFDMKNFLDKNILKNHGFNCNK